MLVSEPTVEETTQILMGLRERYEAHHKLRYEDEALAAAAQYSSQYISDRFLPDKAIDLIDEAGSRVRLQHAQLPEEVELLLLLSCQEVVPDCHLICRLASWTKSCVPF